MWAALRGQMPQAEQAVLDKVPQRVVDVGGDRVAGALVAVLVTVCVGSSGSHGWRKGPVGTGLGKERHQLGRLWRQGHSKTSRRMTGARGASARLLAAAASGEWRPIAPCALAALLMRARPTAKRCACKPSPDALLTPPPLRLPAGPQLFGDDWSALGDFDAAAMHARLADLSDLEKAALGGAISKIDGIREIVDGVEETAVRTKAEALEWQRQQLQGLWEAQGAEEDGGGGVAGPAAGGSGGDEGSDKGWGGGEPAAGSGAAGGAGSGSGREPWPGASPYFRAAFEALEAEMQDLSSAVDSETAAAAERDQERRRSGAGAGGSGRQWGEWGPRRGAEEGSGGGSGGMEERVLRWAHSVRTAALSAACASYAAMCAGRGSLVSKLSIANQPPEHMRRPVLCLPLVSRPAVRCAMPRRCGRASRTGARPCRATSTC